jgi:hypothetical protein
VDVHVDQAGQQRARAEIDAFGAGRDRVALATDRRDAAVDDRHLRVVDALAGEDVDHVRGGDDHGFRVGGDSRGREQRCG